MKGLEGPCRELWDAAEVVGHLVGEGEHGRVVGRAPCAGVPR